MTVVPVLLDARPPYFGIESATSSQLLCPAPGAGVIAELARAIAVVTTHDPYVLCSFIPDQAYVAELRRDWPRLEAVLQIEEFGAMFGKLDPSDFLLFVSPACLPAEGLDLSTLMAATGNRAGMARHLLAFDSTSLRTKEFVQTGEGGRIHRIQRYFEPVTWPFPIGVIASLVPVSCFQMAEKLPLDSLLLLRQALSMTGLPSEDVPFHGDCFDLNDERGALALSEARLRAYRERRRRKGSADDSRIPATAMVHESARVVDPVLIHEGAVIEANALVIGPAIIGRGARVGHGAVVAQCLVLPGAMIEGNVSVRHRVVVPRVARDRREPRAHQRRFSHAAGQRLPTPPKITIWRVEYLQLKAMVEPVLATIALTLLSPLMLLLAILVRATSSGPIFYGDSREGKDGRPFKCWKYRSMLVNANDMQRALKAQQQMDGPQFKMDHDPRVTTVGRWLRRLNVDELPQLWNVARGEMSFVGPRPSPVRENQICVPWRHGRLSVRPGITGLWQVCRHDRALGDFHQWIHYDLLYVHNLSFAVDVKIFLFTILTLGGRRPVALTRVIGTTSADLAPSPGYTVPVRPVVIPPPLSVDFPYAVSALLAQSGSSVPTAMH